MITENRCRQPTPTHVATQNACKLCAPLGACLAFNGLEKTVPFLHGSQGCATYIRRYMISHYKEPIDIASSNFSESTAIFGGKENLRTGLKNVVSQYEPQAIGVATTCLAETIGEDIQMYLHEITGEASGTELPPVIPVSTPSYAGTHAEGYHAAVRAIVDTLAAPGHQHAGINLFTGMISPADIRYLKEIAEDFGLDATLLPDYSDTLDGPAWEGYHRIAEGGTRIEDVRRMGSARASIEMTAVCDSEATAGALLEERFDVRRHRIGPPIGVVQTDELLSLLSELSGGPTPEKHALERGRLVDSFVDAHKHLFDKRVVVFGEEDLVVGIAALLTEIGAVPVLCASGGESGHLRESIEQVAEDLMHKIVVMQGVDFVDIEEQVADLKPDLLIGNSKGYKLSRKLDIPLIRVGFPIHDRIGGQRVSHVGYRGAQRLFDQIVNALLDSVQSRSSIGFTYL
jgi:nitrogenase molybdenum-iron protein NifN